MAVVEQDREVATPPARQYARRGADRLQRLHTQVDPGVLRRLRRLALVSKRSDSAMGALLIEKALPELEAQHAAELAALPDHIVGLDG